MKQQGCSNIKNVLHHMLMGVHRGARITFFPHQTGQQRSQKYAWGCEHPRADAGGVPLRGSSRPPCPLSPRPAGRVAACWHCWGACPCLHSLLPADKCQLSAKTCCCATEAGTALDCILLVLAADNVKSGCLYSCKGISTRKKAETHCCLIQAGTLLAQLVLLTASPTASTKSCSSKCNLVQASHQC